MQEYSFLMAKPVLFMYVNQLNNKPNIH